jgi:hypothetical protein
MRAGSTRDHRRDAGHHLTAEIQLGMGASEEENRGIRAIHRQVVDRKLRGEASGQVGMAAMLPGTAVPTGGSHGIGVKHQQVEVHKARNEASDQAAERNR